MRKKGLEIQVIYASSQSIVRFSIGKVLIEDPLAQTFNSVRTSGYYSHTFFSYLALCHESYFTTPSPTF